MYCITNRAKKFIVSMINKLKVFFYFFMNTVSTFMSFMWILYQHHIVGVIDISTMFFFFWCINNVSTRIFLYEHCKNLNFFCISIIQFLSTIINTGICCNESYQYEYKYSGISCIKYTPLVSTFFILFITNTNTPFSKCCTPWHALTSCKQICWYTIDYSLFMISVANFFVSLVYFFYINSYVYCIRFLFVTSYWVVSSIYKLYQHPSLNFLLPTLIHPHLL